MRKTFDRNYDLFRETPSDLALPWGFNLVRFVSVRSNQHAPLALLHVSEAVSGGDGEALCGESGTIGEDMIGLSANTRYQFCRKCQEAAAQHLTTTRPKGHRRQT
jgi:hypothetical protein